MCIPLKYTCEYNSIILVLYTSQYTSVFSTFCMVMVQKNVRVREGQKQGKHWKGSYQVKTKENFNIFCDIIQ